MYKYLFSIMILFFGFAMQAVEAADQYVSPKRELIGYSSSFTPQNVVRGSAATACLDWPAYHQGTYIFVGVEGDETGGVCIGKRPFDGGWAEVRSSTYSALYRNVCQSPYLGESGSCSLPPPPPEICPCTPEPIVVATGQKYLNETIYQGTGLFPLTLKLFYDSINPNPVIGRMPGGRSPVQADSPYKRDIGDEVVCNLNASNASSALCPIKIPENSNAVDATAPGTGWQANFQIGVAELPDGLSVIVSMPSNKGYLFNLINGVWTPDVSIVGRLVKLIDSSNATIGWKYTNEHDEVYSFNEVGRLSSITNRSGFTHSYTYASYGKLSAITDSFGHQLSFTYDANNRLSTMLDPSGQVFTFTYGAFNNLISVTYPDNKLKTYLYEHASLPHVLTAVVDANGIRYMNYQYDNAGKAYSEEHAGGIGSYQLTLSYNNSTTTVIDPLGTQRTTTFSKVLGRNKMTSQSQPAESGAGAATQSFNYDANGNISSRTDFNGAITTYQYDLSRNLETKRVEASGTPEARTTSTVWHPTYRIPVQINEPLRHTMYTHDVKGNVLTKTEQGTTDANGSAGVAAVVSGTPRVWSYTYNAVGQVLTAKGPRTDVNDVTTYAYDNQGNLISVTNPAGHVTTMSNYDAHGHVGTITDPNGVVTNLTYHVRGWLLSRAVTADGITETTSYTYDGVGQMTKVTMPDNSTVNYTYDDAHRLTKISDHLGNSINYTLDNMGNRINETTTDTTGALSRQITRVYDALNRLKEETGGTQ